MSTKHKDDGGVQLKHRLHFRPDTSFTLFQLRITLFILKSMEPRT
jgi:uncharacterized protein YqhQ